MINRRTLCAWLAWGMPAGTVALGFPQAVSSPADASPARRRSNKPNPGRSTYAPLGVRPLINGRGTVTIVGATRMLPEVEAVMDAASKEYVQLDELMEGVGRRLADITGAEWGCVTSGAHAAVTIATAGCVTGGDPDKLWQIPRLVGMKDEVIVPTYSRTVYDAAARAVGARLIEVEDAGAFAAALGPRTAMIFIHGARPEAKAGPLSLKEVCAVAKRFNVPVLVDAAAQELSVPNAHLLDGADLVAYSGGKRFRGPQCSGILIGRAALVRAAWMTSAPHHGPFRGLKVGREEVMGALTAIEMWLKRDHGRERDEAARRAAHIARRLGPIPGVSIRERSGEGTSVQVQWDIGRIPLTGHEVEQLLWDNNPRIAVGGAGSFLPFPPNEEPVVRVNVSQLEDGEEHMIAEHLFRVLSAPPPLRRPGRNAEFDVGGVWNLEMTFAAGSVEQTLVFEQKGNLLKGTHTGSLATREVAGTLHGREVFFRSSHTRERPGSPDSLRLNFSFSGTATGDSMEGDVSMGEYGMARWKAQRRNYNQQ